MISENADTYSAFTESYGKSYFAVITKGELTQYAGEMTTTRGSYCLVSG